MVRTIYVVYTDQKLGYAQTRCMKQYMFLCPFDNIQAGDMIKDKRYSTAMQVVGWDKNSCEVQSGIKLKVIEPFLLNGMAKYYNGSWEMKAGKAGYFIGKSSMGGSAVAQQVNLTDGIAIYEHRTVQYAGIVYFKNAQDAKEAAKLLFDELNLLF